MNGYKEIPVTYMRGGTSKGAYLLQDTLPTDQAARDRMIFRFIWLSRCASN